MIEQFIFTAVLVTGSFIFWKKIRLFKKGLSLARPSGRNDQKVKRWKTMARVAFGQGKMGARPLSAFFHLIVYLGFVIINIEVIEILLDGLLGKHRVLKDPLGIFYNPIMSIFEWLGILVIIACVVFLIRRHFGKIERLNHKELKGWPHRDALIILYTEIILMCALLVMNASEEAALTNSAPFFFSKILSQSFSNISVENLHLIEKTSWWIHFIGIMIFLNYLPYSKHFHIILAFPNTWYSNLSKRGSISPMTAVTNEIKAIMDPSFIPDTTKNPINFGAKDISDLHFANLLNAYTCTECGRCTDECPANQTGKLLSPRKIMISTRKRVQEALKDPESESALLDNYISREELWACTTCNACVEACPLNIDPLDIIIQMRQYLVMEESSAPVSLNVMNTNIENNGAPWAYSQADRGNWVNEN